MPAQQSISRTLTVATFALLAFGAADAIFSSPAQEPAPFAAHTNFIVPANIEEDSWTGGPRECDLQRGISTECLWLD